jgi:hypothetical protein
MFLLDGCVDVLYDVQHVPKGFSCLPQVTLSANAILEALEASPGLEHQSEHNAGGTWTRNGISVPPEHGDAEPMAVGTTPDGNTGLSQDGNSCYSPDGVHL